MKSMKKWLIGVLFIIVIMQSIVFAQHNQQYPLGNFYYTGTNHNKNGSWHPWTVNEESNVTLDRAVMLCRNHNPQDYVDFVCHWAPNNGGATRDGLEKMMINTAPVETSVAAVAIYGRFYYTGNSQDKKGAWSTFSITEADRITRAEARKLCMAHDPEHYNQFVCHWAPENSGAIIDGLNNF